MAEGKKKPVRKCIACGCLKEKSELFRIVLSESGELTLDLTGKKDGRGAYLCRSADCLEKAEKTHALSRSFRRRLSPADLSALKEEISNELGR